MGQYTVQGAVVDDTSGEPLIGATIRATCTGSGTVTDVFGHFTLRVDGENCPLEASFIGYGTRTVDSSWLTIAQIEIRLSPGIMMDEVKITADYLQERYATDIGVTDISTQTLAKVTNITGEPDIMKSLTMTPGVSSGFEGSSGLIVRGGSPDQNLILLDDAKIYNGTHLAGFVSSFNTDALSHVTLYKGDMPARYGGRLSSVIDVRVRRGNQQKSETSVVFSPLVSKVMHTRPLIKERTSLYVAARGSLFNLFTLPLKISYDRGKRDEYGGYQMLDINAKIHHKISDQEYISFSAFRGSDDLNILSSVANEDFSESRVNLIYGNTALNAKHVKYYNQSLKSNTSLVYSDYKSDLKSVGFPDDGVLNNGITTTNIKNVALKSDWVQTTIGGDLYFGIELEKEWFEPTMIDFINASEEVIRQVDLWDLPKQPNTFATYSSFAWQINDKIILHPGVRLWRYDITDYRDWFVEPRASLGLSVGEIGSFKLAYNRTHQSVHFLSSNGISLPTDFWIPSIDLLPASRTDQWSMGYRKRIGVNYLLKVEGYYKLSADLIALREGIDYYDPEIQITDKLVSGGRGTAYGIELMSHKQYGTFTGWFAYTWSRTLRQFDEINGGDQYPFRYDRIHDLSVTWSYEINDQWTIGSNLIYATGIAVTRPEAVYILQPGTTITHYGSRNNSRLQAYQRMDVSFTRHYKKSELTFSLYNITNAKNPLYERVETHGTRDFDPGGGKDQYILVSEQASLFPFIPSISYRINFNR